MKTLLSIAATAISLCAFSQQSLQLASDVWPPFTNQGDQKAIALDIVETAFFRLNTPMKVQITNFEKVIDGIEQGNFAGSGALWKTPEREETMLFSDPYLQNRLVLVSLKENQIQDGEHKKLGVVSSYAYDIPLLHSEEITAVYSNSDQENFNKLLNHEVDVMLVDELLIQYLSIAQKEEVATKLDISSPIAVKSLHLAIRKDFPDAEVIIDNFNHEINNMIIDGTYNQVLQLNWITADVDGDGIPENVLVGESAGTNPPESPYMLFYDESAQTAVNGSYHINGQLYEHWEDVPQQYKQNVNPDPGKGNMIIRF